MADNFAVARLDKYTSVARMSAGSGAKPSEIKKRAPSRTISRGCVLRAFKIAVKS